MRTRNKILTLCCMLTLLFGLSACGSSEAAADTESAAQSTETEGTISQDAAESGTADDTKNTEEMENSEEPSSRESGSSILVAYFSATGNTRPVAETMAELLGADIFEIIPAEPYTDDDLNYSDDNCRANQEQNDSTVRPEISGTVENMADYDMVLIGHPIWWGEEPRIIDTFVESYDLSGKTAVNFCTSGGSGVSTSTENLKALSPDANWLEGHRFETGASEDIIQEWLNGLDIPSAGTGAGENTVNMTVNINGSDFVVELEKNETAKSFSERLPITMEMSELNGNEKYFYLEETLPADASVPAEIQAGDVMLYNSDCLVLFYESFSTSYSYTPIGHISDTTGLKDVLESGQVTAKWSKG